MFSFVTSHARDFLAGHTHTHVHAFCDGRSSIKGLRARATAHTCIWVIGLIVGDISASAVFFLSSRRFFVYIMRPRVHEDRYEVIDRRVERVSNYKVREIIKQLECARLEI